MLGPLHKSSDFQSTNRQDPCPPLESTKNKQKKGAEENLSILDAFQIYEIVFLSNNTSTLMPQ